MRTCLLLSAALTFGGAGLLISSNSNAQDTAPPAQQPTAAQRAGDSMDRAADKAGNAMRRAGDKMSGATTNPADAMAPDAEDIRETLKEVTQAALTKGGFDDAIERFVDADRDRLTKDGFAKKNHDTLDGRIAQMQKDWKAKYNQDFKIGDKAAVYDASFAQIIQSEVPGARTAGSKVENLGAGKPTVTNPPNNPNNDVAPNGSNPQDANKVGGGETNRNPGRAIATVTIAASHGLPEVRVPMIHEFPDRWKIDVPDDVSAEQMHDNLLKHLTMLDEQKDQWPTDPKEAYRIASHHILAAIMNADAHGENAMPAGAREPAMPSTPTNPQP